MLSFKKKLTVIAIAIMNFNQVSAAPTLSAADMQMLEDSRATIKASREMDAPGWLRQYDSAASIESTSTGVKRWIPAAQQIADDSNDMVKATIKKTYGLLESDTIRTVDMEHHPDSPLVEGEELYYFVSFAQPESEIKEILEEASRVDARVILRGMREGDTMINQTAMAMYQLGKEFKPIAKVSIDSRLHQVFNITHAPSMVYRKDNNVVTVRGVASTKWFLEKARKVDGIRSLGVVSSSYEISEKDVIQEIQERVAKVDWDSKRRKAMNRYVDNLPNFDLPTAQEDAEYKIDPRVQFQKDVTAKDGTLLASKGQVVNPIDHFHQSLTIFIFDGLSEKQRALVKEEIPNSDGTVNLMTSRIDKEKGFQFISDLSKEYGQQVYVLQQRIIDRFQLKNLPAKVFLGNGEIRIKEYGMFTQGEALDRELNASSTADNLQAESTSSIPTN